MARLCTTLPDDAESRVVQRSQKDPRSRIRWSKILDLDGSWIQNFRVCRGILGILDPAFQVLLWDLEDLGSSISGFVVGSWGSWILKFCFVWDPGDFRSWTFDAAWDPGDLGSQTFCWLTSLWLTCHFVGILLYVLNTCFTTLFSASSQIKTIANKLS